MADRFRDRMRERLSEVATDLTGLKVVDSERLQLMESLSSETGALRRELDAIAWTALDYVGGRPQELKAVERRKLIQKARIVWMKDPQAGAAVDLMNDFVIGSGLPKPKANDASVQEVIDEAWADPDNQLVLTSTDAQIALGTDIELQSNVFLLLFDNGDDGKVKLSVLEHDSVENVVRDPDNRLRVMYYVARYFEQHWDFANDRPMMNFGNVGSGTGAAQSQRVGNTPVSSDAPATKLAPTMGAPDAMKGAKGQGEIRYFEHWRNVDLAREEAEEGARDSKTIPLAPDPKLGDGKVFQISINRTMEMAFGHPRMDRLLRWYNAYNRFIDARMDIIEAASAFVMKRQVKGTPQQLQKMATQALSRRGVLGSTIIDATGEERQVGPRPASVLVENDALTHEPFNIDTRAGNAMQDSQMIRAQVSAGTRWPQSYFGDSSNANLATATCHDAATETLTSEGWLSLDELRRRHADGRLPQVAAYDPERDALVYETPKRMVVRRYEGEMVRLFAPKRMDALVTPNHRMLVRRGDDLRSARPFAFIEAGALRSGCRYYAKAAAPFMGGARVETFVLPGVAIRHGNGRGRGSRVLTTREPVTLAMDALLDWLGWYIAEGSDASVAQAEDSRWLPEILTACRNLGVEGIERWKRGRDGKRMWLWTAKNPKQLRSWLDQHVGVGTAQKRVPAFVFALAPDQQMRVLRGLMGGDGGCGASKTGWERAGTSYFATTSEGLADDVQRLAMHAGFRAVVRRSEPYETARGARRAYSVVLTAPAKSASRGTHGAWVSLPPRERVMYRGDVYCFEMPSGTVVTRRNGRVTISGNSLELPVLKAVETRQEKIEQLVRWFVDRVIERAVETGRISEKLTAAEKQKQERSAKDTNPMAGYEFGPALITEDYEDQPADEQSTERDLGYEFSMPSPLKRMMSDLIAGIQSIAQTFDPNNTNMELSRTLLTIALGEALELEDPAGAVEKIFPPGYVDPAVVAAQQQAQQGPTDALEPRGDGASPFGEFGPGAPGAPGADGDRHSAGNPYGSPQQSMSPDNPYGLMQAAVTAGRDGGPVVWGQSRRRGPTLALSESRKITGDLAARQAVRNAGVGQEFDLALERILTSNGKKAA